MIKATLLEIRSAEGAMRKISTMVTDIKSAYWLSRLIKKLDSEVADFEKMRMKLIEQYGKKDEKGGVQVTPENLPVFNEEFVKLLGIEVEIDMPLIKFELIKNLKLTADDVLALEKFVEDIGLALEKPEETKKEELTK